MKLSEVSTLLSLNFSPMAGQWSERNSMRILIDPSASRLPLITETDLSLFNTFILVDSDLCFLNDLALFLEAKGKDVKIIRSIDELSKTFHLVGTAYKSMLSV
ncbi:hypothetical protein [Sphingobacterium tabacisoli]|uniref:Uncharacterized protein n=1 Tax=Sphingobacterium tabacisoli TaxID=2044855 RepID=A0ABW5L4L8_9SPHI|nr:hypothetical protein [Sphingobacterium tabacisoli]